MDDFSRYKIVRFIKQKGDAADALRNIIATELAPAGLKIGAIRTDGGGEFGGQFQPLLYELGVRHERTPPHTPQHNGVVERALGLRRDKIGALLRGVKEGKTDRLWAEAMNHACDMLNRCVTTSLDRGVSPHEL